MKGEKEEKRLKTRAGLRASMTYAFGGWHFRGLMKSLKENDKNDMSFML